MGGRKRFEGGGERESGRNKSKPFLPMESITGGG